MRSCARPNGPPPSPKPAAGLSVLFQTTNLICAFTRPCPNALAAVSHLIRRAIHASDSGFQAIQKIATICVRVINANSQAVV